MKASLTITFANNANYGAFLQAYSLQNLIGRKNDIANEKPLLKHLVSYQRRKKFKLLWRILAGYRLFFRKTALHEIYRLRIKEQSIFLCKNINQKYSIFITGSDQVWNPNFISEREEIYFLNFTPPSAKRISYAASLGMKQWPKDFEQRVLPMLQKFNAISVREESSVPYLTSLGLKNVVCVCDPTILHTGDFYRREFPGARIPKNEYAFVYKIREQIPEAVRQILPKNTVTVDLQKKRTIVSVTDWLGLIDHAKFIVTDSFHCAVFCILFHKPFVVLPNNSSGKGMNERFATLLGKTNLEYRCLSLQENAEELHEKMFREIDWEKVDASLEKWRNYSANWLKNALES